MGESKIATMIESSEFRAGTSSLEWERDKLIMELEDLNMKWNEIQHTKVGVNLRTYIIVYSYRSLKMISAFERNDQRTTEPRR